MTNESVRNHRAISTDYALFYHLDHNLPTFYDNIIKGANILRAVEECFHNRQVYIKKEPV